MTINRNYLQEAFDIAESKTSELGLRYLPEAAHIKALVDVIKDQKHFLESIHKEIMATLKEAETTVKQKMLAYEDSKNDFKVGLTD